MESAVSNLMEREGKMMIAHQDDLKTIQHLIPYLQHRKETAKRYYRGGLNEEAKEQLFELLTHINKEIAKIIGI